MYKQKPDVRLHGQQHQSETISGDSAEYVSEEFQLLHQRKRNEMSPIMQGFNVSANAVSISTVFIIYLLDYYLEVNKYNE